MATLNEIIQRLIRKRCEGDSPFITDRPAVRGCGIDCISTYIPYNRAYADIIGFIGRDGKLYYWRWNEGDYKCTYYGPECPEEARDSPAWKLRVWYYDSGPWDISNWVKENIL